MKKILLTSLIIGSSIASFAQGIQAAAPGFAWDSFDKAKEYGDVVGTDPSLGIYLFRDSTNLNTPYIKGFKHFTDGKYAYNKTREGDGVLSFIVSQPYGLFKPQIGVVFGDGKTINLTGTSSLVLRVGLKIDIATVPNLEGVKIKFGIKSINGLDTVAIDSKGSLGGKTNQYLNELAIQVKKNKAGTALLAPTVPNESTMPPNTITFPPSTEPGVILVDINFNGGYEAVYPAIQLKADGAAANACVGAVKGNGGTGVVGASNPKKGFDSTHVSGFQLTFLSANQVSDDCYFNEELVDFKVDFTEFKLGDLTVGLGYDEEVFNKRGFIAYPSPIKGGNLKLSATAENVKVYDVLGTMVFSANSASEINVDGFNKGLYIVKSSKGSTRFVVE